MSGEPMIKDQEKIEQLLSYHGQDEVKHFTNYLLDTVESKKVKRFRGAFPMFDEKLGGIETGEVVVVSGHTKHGKTLFAESWIHGMMQNDEAAKVVVFSFEVQTEKMLIKYVSEDSLPLFVPASLKTMDFNWLKERCAEAKFKFNCRVVLIDHLHFLVDMDTRQNMSLNIGAFMRRLKQEIALGLNLAVVIIAHQGQAKEGVSASIGGIRDSSFVGQEADSVLLVSRVKNFNNEQFAAIEKRYGADRMYQLQDIQNKTDRLDDDYSAGFSKVTIARTRRTGVFDVARTFRKNGDFLEEI